MFPNYELRIKTIEKLLNKYDIKNIAAVKSSRSY